MIKIFFITFFGAELIIASAIILRLLQFDICVNRWNKLVLVNQMKIKNAFFNSRLFLENFTTSFGQLTETINRKRQEYLFSFAKTAFIYFGIFFSKGKYRKAILAYQIIKEIYDELNEAEI